MRPGTLRSKTGCLTCVARRKKCDERRPVCGDCHRLGLKCTPRDDVKKRDERRRITTSPTTVSLRAQDWTLSDGYERFHDDAERRLSIECPSVLGSFVSQVAGEQYRDLTFFTNAAIQDVWVRQAVVAFSAAFQLVDHRAKNEICLRNYHACTQNIRKYLSGPSNAWEVNNLIISLTLLGILEVLNFGDPVSIVALLSICGDALVQQIRLRSWSTDQTITKLYRMAAECIIYNAATLGLYLPKRYGLSRMWNNLLNELFPDSPTIDCGSSPFLGGFHAIYKLMLRITSIFWEQRTFEDIEPEYNLIMTELELLDQMVPNYYESSRIGLQGIRLYQGKQYLHICVLQILMQLVSRPRAEIDERQLEAYTKRAVWLLKEYDLRERNHPGVCWPLIVLACIVDEEDDFRFIISKADQIHAVVDPANKSKWSSDVRQRILKARYHPEEYPAGIEYPATLLDFLVSLNYPSQREVACADQ